MVVGFTAVAMGAVRFRLGRPAPPGMAVFFDNFTATNARCPCAVSLAG